MHRAAMAVVVCGYAFGGIGTGIGQRPVGHQPASPAGNRVAATAAVTKSASEAVTKTVRFGGYEFNVPASWPVYRLDADPGRCVRYDVHAVYLGTPGSSQNCPAGLVGRIETISVAGPSGGARPAVISQRAVVRGKLGWAGTPGKILQDASQQEYRIALPASAPSITATYGPDPGLIQQILASVRHVTRQSAPTAPAGPIAPAAPAGPIAPAAPTAPALPNGPAGTKPAGPAAVASPVATPAASPAVPASPSALPSPALTLSHGPRAGFDTCTAPSLAAMRAWRAKFSVAGIYIGGQEMACGYGNLSADWVRKVQGLGWSLLPTYVGPQAPCNPFSGRIDTKHAAAQGRQNAQWAVQDAVSFGLKKGAPIYYDMEAYNNRKTGCATAVLTFLDAWTRQLNAEGFVSGVYSSAGSGVIDLATTSNVAGHALAKPQSIWFALWDNASDLNGSPYLPGRWPASRRSKQFAGSHWVKIQKIGLNIDSDLVNSAVAG